MVQIWTLVKKDRDRGVWTSWVIINVLNMQLWIYFVMRNDCSPSKCVWPANCVCHFSVQEIGIASHGCTSMRITDDPKFFELLRGHKVAQPKHISRQKNAWPTLSTQYQWQECVCVCGGMWCMCVSMFVLLCMYVYACLYRDQRDQMLISSLPRSTL